MRIRPTRGLSLIPNRMQSCCFSTSSVEPSPKIDDSVKLRPITDIRYRFGVIADVQFAPKLDAPNYSRTRVRRFHHALGEKGLVKAINTWNSLYDNPHPLFSKGGRNPLIPHSDKPMGCMCETDFCKSKKCHERAERMASHSSAIFRAGVHVRHLSPSSSSSAVDTDACLVPARPMDAVLQLGDLIDGSNAALKSFLYAPPQRCKADCPYCGGRAEPLAFEAPAETSATASGAGAASDADAVFLKHMSTLQPPPCPVLAQGIRDNIEYAYKHTLAEYQKKLSPTTSTTISDLQPPSYATSLALASVYERISRAKCPQWHHLLGNHELYNIARALVYPLFGRGVKHGSLIPDEARALTHDTADDEAKAVAEADPEAEAEAEGSDGRSKYDAIGSSASASSPGLPANPPTAPSDPYSYFHYYHTRLQSTHTDAPAAKAPEAAPASSSSSSSSSAPAMLSPPAPAPSASASVTVAVDPAPASTFFLIVLDAYRLAMMGTPQTHQAYVQSKAFLAQHNPNIREGKTGDWSVGLKGGDMRYVPFNGALGTDQLAWLEQVLENMPHGARAIVTCHVSAQPDSTGPSTTLWDREELLAIFRRFPGKVCLYLSGHDHDGGYAYDAISLTHHLTVAAPIECRPEEEAFAVMDLYDDGCQVYGAGKIPDMFLSFTDHAFN